MIHTVYITDVHTHAESLGSDDQLLLSLLELLHNGCFLHLVLFAVISGHIVPVSGLYPSFETHLDASGKRIVEQCLVSVQKVFRTGQHHALLGSVVSFSRLYLHLPDVKADVPALHRTHIEHTRLHLQRTYCLEYHVVAPLRIPHSRSCQRKQGEGITKVLLQLAEISSQEPIVHTEFLAPRSDRMCFVDNHHPDAAFTHKVPDVIGEKQLR